MDGAKEGSELGIAEDVGLIEGTIEIDGLEEGTALMVGIGVKYPSLAKQLAYPEDGRFGFLDSLPIPERVPSEPLYCILLDRLPGQLMP